MLSILIKQQIIKKTYNAIKKYFIRGPPGLKLKQKVLDSINYSNKKHILLALVCHLSLDLEYIQSRTIFKKLNETLVADQVKFNEDTVEPLYKTLIHKRLYKISPLVGAFKLERYSIQKLDYKDILRLHWDYFVFNTPVWQQRIKNCNGTTNDKKYELSFQNDNDHESIL